MVRREFLVGINLDLRRRYRDYEEKNLNVDSILVSIIRGNILFFFFFNVILLYYW